MPIDVGTLATVEWTNTTGHTVTLDVTKPDGTPLTPSPVVTPGATSYSAQIPCDQPGAYTLRWTDTEATKIYVDILDVWPADPRFLISVETAMDGMKWKGAQRAGDDAAKLRLYVAAATEVIEGIIGAVLGKTITQPADGGRTGVALWERPTEILSVTVDGTATTSYIPNLNAAIVYSKPAGSRFTDGLQNIVITYRTGGEIIPPSVQLAASELIRHLWQVGQQAMTGNPAESTQQDSRQTGLTRTGFAVPNRVIELLGNRPTLPGTA